ncbi:lymphocyte activation gene 3 protein-like [Sinocyclocheilus grahami]|uniref:lymphocyte activation gene 3 protein-like n=1 Tax=Sinocyclocheilus grahami TaxID=75366 RepID=UPI0007ACD188|nr:PREDICTED: lymphocyte activation gene 3 protein-like [Sinocyclocheilus grahami]
MNKTHFLMVLGLALVFEGSQCQEREVFVAQGSVAVLPCVDETSAISHPTAVYWSRIVGNVLKTVWRRDKNGLEFRPVRDSPRANCPISNFGKSDYSLHITETTIEDGGKYVCEVEGKTQMVKVINLRVVRASFSPAIVVEGLITEAKCDISPGTHFVSINWKQNGIFTSRTRLSDVSQRDAGHWTCRVAYNGGVVEATTSLQVKGIAAPQDDSSVVYAAVGSSVSLPCVFTDGLIPYTVMWRRTSTTSYSSLPLPASFSESAGPSASATIQRVEDGDEGMYTCSGMMKGLNRGRIKVQRRMELVVTRGEWNNISREDSEYCANLTRLSDVSQRDAGHWTCRVAYNGGVVEATTSLQVKGIAAPQDDSSVVYAAVGSSVSLPCVFTDGLIPYTVMWRRTSTTSYSSLPLPASFSESAGPSASATIQRVEDGDEGMYTCSGMMKGLNRGRIKVQRRMELVVTRVSRSSSSSGNGPVTLTCHLSNSSQITSYEWLRVTYGPNDTQTVTSVQKTKSYRIQEVTEKDAGEWVCRFYGKQGVLGNVTYQIHVMGAVKSGNSSSGNKTAMVMGLGFLFLVIFLILFQMYRNYRRKKTILLYPAMETIVHQAATEREQRGRSGAKMAEACVGDPKPVCV